MWNFLYDHLVRSDKNVQYEYERYVREHLEEHYTNRYKQWQILCKLNIHYRWKKKKEPMIYFDGKSRFHSQTDGPVADIYNTYILPGLMVYDRLLMDMPEDTKILLFPYAGTGDAYMTGMYIRNYVETEGIGHYVVAVIGGANVRVAKLFQFPETEKLTQQEADCLIRLAMFAGDQDDTIRVMHHHAPQVYYGILENFRNINGLTFSGLFINTVFGHSPELHKQIPKFERNRAQVDAIMKANRLEEGKTVILSPYANTLPPLPGWLWVQLALELKKRGYVVCTNCGSQAEEAVRGTIPLRFAFDISVPLLERCGYFIGIRSGFCDVVSGARCRKIILYQPYIFWGEGTNYDYFSLNKNGFCDDAIELEHHGVEFTQLIKEVLFHMNSKQENNMTTESKNTEIRHIIVQAGGKGTRLGYLTENKPKALLPVDNLPMIFHLFRKFPDAHFIIIGDYKYDVLERYLSAFADVNYTLINAAGRKGTCGGLREAMEALPQGVPFMLIWSDLILSEKFTLEQVRGGNFVGLSEDFPCRWKYENQVFAEEPSSEYGVAGLFAFTDRNLLESVPEEGEFVRWLSGQNEIDFQPVGIACTKEYGILEEYVKQAPARCRPFNRLEVYRGVIIKKGIDEQGRMLAKREEAWYRKVQESGFPNLPRIFSYDPIVMEKIEGKNIYEYENLSFRQKKDILEQAVNCLRELHRLGQVEADRESYEDAYIGKTMKRLEKVRNLVPYANEAYIEINGKRCRNFFFHLEEVERLFESYMPKTFVFLHGDCTFSNMMLKDDSVPVLIDPRGYFGNTELYGDEAYDWAKLYYSIVGNYDQFNLKRFRLSYDGPAVTLEIKSSGWEDMEETFFSLLGESVTRTQIRLIHAVIWLSLTTYAWEDYDSICGAFYNGLYYLEDVL